MRADTSILRGDILKTVYEVSGEGAKTAEVSIKRGYYSYYDYKDITRAITYLEQEGYIRKIVQTNPITGAKSNFYCVTPKGIRIIERLEQDPGIAIAEEDK